MTNPSNKGRRSANRRQTPEGYIEVWLPEHPLARSDGYVFEHRMVAFDAGLLQDQSMHVHHRNHDKADNRLENLEVVDVVQHARHHAHENGYIANQFGVWPLRPYRDPKTERPCAGCSRTVSIERRSDALYCSSNCRIRVWKQKNRSLTGLQRGD